MTRLVQIFIQPPNDCLSHLVQIFIRGSNDCPSGIPGVV